LTQPFFARVIVNDRDDHTPQRICMGGDAFPLVADARVAFPGGNVKDPNLTATITLIVQ